MTSWSGGRRRSRRSDDAHERRRRPCLIIFARVPRLGVGKRRLAAAVGDLAALRFSRLTLMGVVRRLCLSRRRRWRCRLVVTPDAAAWRWPRGGLGLGRGLSVWPQGRGDLGARMERAIRAAGPGPVVLIGADIPAVAPDHVRRALAALGRAPVVLGPAADGGWWLIGVRGRGLPFRPFRGVVWSQPTTLVDTVAALRRAGLRAAPGLVDRLADVDGG